jgi:Flp pilus assembly protein TadB
MRKGRKKGSVFDAFIITLVLFAFCIIILIGGTVLQSIKDNTVNRTFTITNAAGESETIEVVNQSLLEKGQTAFNRFDSMLPFILIGLIACAVVLAFQIPTHPVMIVPSIFVALISVIVAAQLTNAWAKIASQSQLANQANNMPMSVQIMNNLPLIGLLAAIVIMVAMFVVIKNRPGVGG